MYTPSVLVVPTVMAVRRGFPGGVRQMMFVLAVGLTAVVLGAAASYWLDVPTGAAIVCTFGVLLGLQVVAESLVRIRT